MFYQCQYQKSIKLATNSLFNLYDCKKALLRIVYIVSVNVIQQLNFSKILDVYFSINHLCIYVPLSEYSPLITSPSADNF